MGRDRVSKVWSWELVGGVEWAEAGTEVEKKHVSVFSKSALFLAYSEIDLPKFN